MLGISGWLGLCGPGIWSLLLVVLYLSVREKMSWCFQVLDGVFPYACGSRDGEHQTKAALCIPCLTTRGVIPPEAAATFPGGSGSPDLSF